ncbi:hypothetical protein [Streptomyces sp. Isolate_219]|uniref:hypothetical protein n=1 Tax=Streptomyces sp. Isolate_219 TaxID=2950110 RepID=UPI0021CA05E9|nr:hypothetical protein [Streptomyces sp. Isolate_219]MCR8575030.1 hypothetical protein [Streptomyces sp. Isolate_219]
MLTVVSADVDTTTGVGAVLLVWYPNFPWAREHTALLEWYDEQWEYVGGGSGTVSDPADVDVIELCGGGDALSLTGCLDAPRSVDTTPRIHCVEVHLGPDVGQILFGSRRIDAPERRKLIAAWMSPHASRSTRPVVVALGHDGTELSRIGPYDTLDTHTWARLAEES